jgi:hypothetical protein
MRGNLKGRNNRRRTARRIEAKETNNKHERNAKSKRKEKRWCQTVLERECGAKGSDLLMTETKLDCCREESV